MKSKRIIIFDTECNSLDTKEGFIQELAWGIFDVNNWRLLKSRSSLIKWNKLYTVEKGAYETTGLSRDYCEENGEMANRVLGDFLVDAFECDYVCAHNLLGYDEQMMTTNIRRMAFYTIDSNPLDDKFRIDTLIDCPYPKSMKIMSLKYLALDHGFVHQGAHEALADVFACKHVLSSYDFQKVKEIASTPVVTVSSKIEWLDTNARERLKQQRFYWNPIKKVWEKRIREYWLKDIQFELGDEIYLTSN